MALEKLWHISIGSTILIFSWNNPHWLRWDSGMCRDGVTWCRLGATAPLLFMVYYLCGLYFLRWEESILKDEEKRKKHIKSWRHKPWECCHVSLVLETMLKNIVFSTHCTHSPSREAEKEDSVVQFFLCAFEEKVEFFKPNWAINLLINTRVLIHNYSFRTWRFKRNASAKSINGGVSLQPLFLDNVLIHL